MHSSLKVRARTRFAGNPATSGPSCSPDKNEPGTYSVTVVTQFDTTTYRIPGPWNHEAFSLFRIPGPRNHEIFAQFAQKRIFDALSNVNDLTCKFKEIDVPDEFASNLIQAILDWSKHALNDIPDEHKQTALRHMKITSTGFGAMNRITSPAIRNGILPVITLDFLLHAVDPLHPASPSPRAFAAHVEREEILQRPTLDVETIVDGTKRRCLTASSMLNNNSKPGDTAMYNMTQAAFMLKAMREGKMVMTLDAFVDLALLWVSFRFAWIDLTENSQAHQEDLSITRSEVAAILNDPNVDGVCAAPVVAAAVSPILLLSTSNYANATYNPSTSVFDTSVSSD
ncbi:hypothetical protein R3P38DRAFT_3199344 [Favolaschia claudopus]|uniref:Uncharacterized protein n=1 Tax=Favolaschia claudopus TaxID=2862362 RepID=A0AAW0B0N3_9AGAR